MKKVGGRIETRLAADDLEAAKQGLYSNQYWGTRKYSILGAFRHYQSLCLPVALEQGLFALLSIASSPPVRSDTL